MGCTDWESYKDKKRQRKKRHKTPLTRVATAHFAIFFVCFFASPLNLMPLVQKRSSHETSV